jgi:hypothetical protein
MLGFPLASVLSASERVYRLLLFVYPAAYRREYGPPMIQAYRDLCWNSYRQRGMVGLGSLWLRLLADLFTSSIQQHLDALRGGRIMTEQEHAQATVAVTWPLSMVGRLGLYLQGVQKMIRKTFLLVPSAVLVLCACALTVTWLYTTTCLQHARASYGVYPTPEEGMSALLWEGQHQIEAKYIKYSGPSCVVVCSPHVWFVHVAGSGKGGGAYFLHVKEGWVHVPESAFPDFIGLGMSLFGLAPKLNSHT